ncbi:MAG TPA: flagellar biosynthesis repressor FlbT [Hyphomicrobiaceae bacterium]|jgi:flagellar protein FlbT|nr:flagellar biosynthesis repressor FlbT [Hyphomicrobiaceae bacterium]
MKRGMHIFLRPGERVYVNGAVLRVDRKVSMEFLNEVTFLLEQHVMQAENATTPLRQLYFVVQSMLIDPATVARSRKMFETSVRRLNESFSNPEILAGLKNVEELVASNRVFEALKAIRTLFPIEEAILTKQAPVTETGTIELELAPCK